MKLLLFLVSLPLAAQAVLTPAFPPAITPGTTFQATVAASSGPSNMAGYQFTLALPAGISLTRCQSLVASKDAVCPTIPAGGLPGTFTAFLVGMNSSGLIHGPTMRLYLKAGTLTGVGATFALTNTVVTTGDAHSVIPSTGGSVTVPYVCKCGGK